MFLLSWLFGGFFKKTLKEAAVEEDDFDEYQSTLGEIKQQLEDIQETYAEGEKTLEAQEKDNERLAKKIRDLKRGL